MNDHGKSDMPVVPAKRPNNAGVPAAEAVEERGMTKGNTATLVGVVLLELEMDREIDKRAPSF